MCTSVGWVHSVKTYVCNLLVLFWCRWVLQRNSGIFADNDVRRTLQVWAGVTFIFKLFFLVLIIINNSNSKTMFMVLSSQQSHCESSPSSFAECRMAPSRRPKTKPDDLGCESACTGCQSLHPPSPFIIITQPESQYSFYRPTEGRRLSQPS